MTSTFRLLALRPSGRGARVPAAIGAALALCCVAASSAHAVLPQPPPARPLPNPAFVTDKAVDALARSANTIYLGGDFTRIGPPTGGGVVLDPASGLRAAQFPDVRGIGFAIVPDGAGGYYVGGRFTHVGGLPRKNLAHVLASGAVDPAFAPIVDGDVLALALDGGRLYVGGDFPARTRASRTSPSPARGCSSTAASRASPATAAAASPC
jgi:hypothetical protein